MRGKPVSGFRLTEKRISAGILTKQLLAQHRQIERLRSQGKSLSPLLAQANKVIESNARLARRKNLLGTEISSKHAVEKSAIRRQVLLKKVA